MHPHQPHRVLHEQLQQAAGEGHAYNKQTAVHHAPLIQSNSTTDRFALLCTPFLLSRCTALTHQDRSHSTHQFAPTKQPELHQTHHSSTPLSIHQQPGPRQDKHLTWKVCPRASAAPCCAGMPSQNKSFVKMSTTAEGFCNMLVHNSRGFCSMLKLHPTAHTTAGFTAASYCTHNCRIHRILQDLT